jgi:hypothetical protein
MTNYSLIDETYPDDTPQARALQDALHENYDDDGWCTASQEMTPEEWQQCQEYNGAVLAAWHERRRDDYVQSRQVAEMYKKWARQLGIEAWHVYADEMFDKLRWHDVRQRKGFGLAKRIAA